jgi:hypothetical protein
VKVKEENAKVRSDVKVKVDQVTDRFAIAAVVS